MKDDAMKAIRILSASAALALSLGCGSAYATDTDTVSASAKADIITAITSVEYNGTCGCGFT